MASQSTSLSRHGFVPYLLLISATLMWAGNLVTGRAVYQAVTPIALTFWRWFIAALILLPFEYKNIVAERAVLMQNFGRMLSITCTGIVLYSMLVYQSLHYTYAINSSILLSLTPLLIIAFSWMFFQQKIGGVQIIGLALSFLGALLIVSKGSLRSLMQLGFNKGDLLMVVAAMVWAVYTLLLQKKKFNIPSRTLFAASVGLGVLLLLPLYIGQMLLGYQTPFSMENVTAIGYIAVFGSVLGYSLWAKGVETIGANRAGLFLHLIPVFSVFLAVVLLHESLTWYHVAGLVMVLAGIVVTNRFAVK